MLTEQRGLSRSIGLDAALRAEYQKLFKTCQIRPTGRAEVTQIARAIERHADRYRAVEKRTGVPWYVIAVIHSKESSLDFRTHLHNGDPLSARTVHVPRNRPPGDPPFTWEAS